MTLDVEFQQSVKVRNYLFRAPFEFVRIIHGRPQLYQRVSEGLYPLLTVLKLWFRGNYNFAGIQIFVLLFLNIRHGIVILINSFNYVGLTQVQIDTTM